jgi:hypothetical protein
MWRQTTWASKAAAESWIAGVKDKTKRRVGREIRSSIFTIRTKDGSSFYEARVSSRILSRDVMAKRLERLEKEVATTKSEIKAIVKLMNILKRRANAS